MRQGRISAGRLLVVAALLAHCTPAEAGFLEDLFGGSDSTAPSAPVRKTRPRATERRFSNKDAGTRPNPGHSEIRFMPFHGDRKEDQSEKRLSIVHRGYVDRQSLRRLSSVNEDQPGFRETASSASASGKPVGPSLCKLDDSSPSTLGPFLYDRTLRSGDVVVTEKGVQIFRGQKACPHGADNFIALSSAVVPKNRRNILLAIENAAMQRPNGYLVTAKNGK